MTEWTPKRGDKVTVVGADDRVWVVANYYTEPLVEIHNGKTRLTIPSSTVTPVPVLPPEPPVDTIGWVDGMPAFRDADGWWGYASGVFAERRWPDIADRFVTRDAVIEEVCAWLVARGGKWAAYETRAHFLGGDRP